jgi:uncharacterized protein YerC
MREAMVLDMPLRALCTMGEIMQLEDWEKIVKILNTKNPFKMPGILLSK